MRDTSQRGTSVALSVIACLLSFAFMGCLVTTDIDVPEPPLCPPVIHSLAVDGVATDLGAVIYIDPTVGSMTTFRVGIRDCNQGQAIQTLVLRNWNGEPETLFGALIKRDEDVEHLENDPELAEYEFSLMHEPRLTDNFCHKLQLFLTSEFTFDLTGPVTEGDIGEITWWLMVDSDLTSPVPVSACQ